MRLTKFGHACVRVEDSGTTVVIDPGMFTEPEAVDGVDAVLVTHEHPDHYHPELLRRASCPVIAVPGVAERLRADDPATAERLRVVRPGDRLDFGPVSVAVIGSRHAVIHPEIPIVDNSGYLLDVGGVRVFHPGDNLTVPAEHDPDAEVDVLLLPVSAPWLKISECIDYARTVAAATNLAIHDRIYSDVGLGIVGGLLERLLGERGQTYLRREPGEDL